MPLLKETYNPESFDWFETRHIEVSLEYEDGSQTNITSREDGIEFFDTAFISWMEHYITVYSEIKKFRDFLEKLHILWKQDMDLFIDSLVSQSIRLPNLFGVALQTPFRFDGEKFARAYLDIDSHAKWEAADIKWILGFYYRYNTILEAVKIGDPVGKLTTNAMKKFEMLQGRQRLLNA